jgi:adrenodoxin-NADP+ reductase
MDILLKGSPTPPSESQKSWSLDFLLSPSAFLPSPHSPSSLATTQFTHTTLSSPFDPKAYTLPPPHPLPPHTIPSSIAFRSIGYKSTPLPEFSDLNIPFNDRHGVISNDGRGRVQHEERSADAAMQVGRFPGLYCAGWVKRGPTGVIASTMEDAFGTADAIAEDWADPKVGFLKEGETTGNVGGWEAVRGEVEGEVGRVRVVNWDGWRRIDAAERERGKRVGKEREKFVRTGDMLAVLG